MLKRLQSEYHISIFSTDYIIPARNHCVGIVNQIASAIFSAIYMIIYLSVDSLGCTPHLQDYLRFLSKLLLIYPIILSTDVKRGVVLSAMGITT